MADMCYESQFSDNGYFCRFMVNGYCIATNCKQMLEYEERVMQVEHENRIVDVVFGDERKGESNNEDHEHD